MRTPAGKECRYFYGDYHRGHFHEECRLIGSRWSQRLCFTCPVPEIIQANACEHLILNAQVNRPFLILKPRVEITAFCKKNNCEVLEPQIGCGSCHPLPPFIFGEEDSESNFTN